MKSTRTLIYWFIVLSLGFTFSFGVGRAFAGHTETEIVPAAPVPNHTFGTSVERSRSSGWNQTHAFGSVASSDRYGRSVAIDGDAILVGSPWENGGGNKSGRVTVLTFNGSNWDAVSLNASDEGPQNNFGDAVALDNGCAIVGAPHSDFTGATGATYVYNDLLNFPLPIANFVFKIICCVSLPPDPIGPVTFGMKYLNLTDERHSISRWAELTRPDLLA